MKFNELHKIFGSSLKNNLSVTALFASIILLFTLLTYIAVRISLIHDEVYSEYATSSAYANAQERFRNECVSLASVKEITDCFDRSIDSAREPQRSEEDLYAQKQMAVWAEWAFYITLFIGVVSIVVAGAGVLLVRNTLDLQRIATKAATDANDMARNAYIADQRPWVSVNVAIDAPMRWQGQLCSIGFRFTLKNTGRTPAIGAWIELKILATPIGTNLPAEQNMLASLGAVEEDEWRGRHILPDQEIIDVCGEYISSNEFRRAFNMWKNAQRGDPFQLHPVVIGYVFYYSVSGDPPVRTLHKTPFVFQIARAKNNIDSLGISPSAGDIPPEDLGLAWWAPDGPIG